MLEFRADRRHYPQYLWICAPANRIDVVLLGVRRRQRAVLAKTFAAILFRLGRFGHVPTPASPPR
ncbi:MAG: hypothetical protein IPQ07_33035 [Myxococcales bacterium]|nr:hypothetical protein [Myxococcales bacterium]